MPTSAKQLGLAVDDIELENRLRRMEVAIESKADNAALSDDGSEVTQRVDIIPKVTGLAVSGSTPGAITVAWNQVRISDLRRYELDVAEDLAFSENAETKNIAGTEFTYNTNSDTGGGGDTTIFIRVRARSSSGNVGPYSATLNTTTGQAQTADIADDAVNSAKVDSTVIVQLALKEYITPRGFHMSNAEIDTTRDALLITAGVARGEADDGTVDLTADITKDITKTLEIGNNNGGFPSTALTLVDGGNYRVFVFSKVDGSGTDAGYDTNPAAANLIQEAVLLDSAYSGALYRQIGWVNYISAAAGIRSFLSPLRDPELVIWMSDIKSTGLTESTTQQTYTSAAPVDTHLHFSFKWTMRDDADQDQRYMYMRSTRYTADAAASGTNFTFRAKEEGENESDIQYNWPDQLVELDSSQQFFYKHSGGADNTQTLYETGFRFYR